MGRGTAHAHVSFPPHHGRSAPPPENRWGPVACNRVILPPKSSTNLLFRTVLRWVTLHCPLPPHLAQARRERDGALCKGPAATFARA